MVKYYVQYNFLLASVSWLLINTFNILPVSENPCLLFATCHKKMKIQRPLHTVDNKEIIQTRSDDWEKWFPYGNLKVDKTEKNTKASSQAAMAVTVSNKLSKKSCLLSDWGTEELHKPHQNLLELHSKSSPSRKAFAVSLSSKVSIHSSYPSHPCWHERPLSNKWVTSLSSGDQCCWQKLSRLSHMLSQLLSQLHLLIG